MHARICEIRCYGIHAQEGIEQKENRREKKISCTFALIC